MRRFKGVIFDLDGTLADTLPVCIGAFRSTFILHAGKELTDTEIEATFGPSEEGAIQRVVGEPWEPALGTFLREYEALHQLCPAAFPGVGELLDMLEERRTRAAIVTGKGAKSAEISLRRLGLAHRFEIVESGSPAGPIKPQSIVKVLDRWQFGPSDVLYVGDAPSDVRSARASGVFSVAALWASSAKRDQVLEEEPDAAFFSVTELKTWLADKLL